MMRNKLNSYVRTGEEGHSVLPGVLWSAAFHWNSFEANQAFSGELLSGSGWGCAA